MILPLLTFCEIEYLLAKYPAPLWILTQSPNFGMRLPAGRQGLQNAECLGRRI